MKYIDIHSHFSFDYFKNDRDDVYQRMQAASVGTITIGVDLKSSQEAVACAEKYENVWASIGHHPEDTPDELFDEKGYKELVTHPKVVSIGECGFDYFRLKDDIVKEKKRQLDDFEAHIEFALKHDKPLMLHCRPSKDSMDAYEDALDLLESRFKEVGDKLRGNFHFFVGDLVIAKRVWNIGFSTSFPGVITFANQYDDVVKAAPADLIQAETDSPYATPVPYRGQRGEPTYVVEVVKKLAELRNEDEHDTRNQLFNNAQILFDLDI